MKMNRRHFLRHAGALGMTSTAMGAMGGMVPALQAQAADVSGYKAIVCLFLFGGMDHWDTVIPYDQTSYDAYADIRAPLIDLYAGARARTNLLPLNPVNAAEFGGREFALPPELSGVRDLFNAGNAAIVSNVGPLINNVTRSQVEDNTAVLPARLFSHNDQQSTWQALGPEGEGIGWGGLFADAAINSFANSANAFTTISASGNSLFLTGQRAVAYPVTSEGGADFGIIQQVNSEFFNRPELISAVRSQLQSTTFDGDHLIGQDVGTLGQRAVLDNEAYNAAFAMADDSLAAFFPASGLGSQLRSVAESISLRGNLGMSRQIFYTAMGGFDTHSDQAGSLPELHQTINDAVVGFYNAMDALGIAEDVLLFTATDFGRTLAVNGDGTDHGWGGHSFVIGGGVQGNRIHGQMPFAEYDHENDAGGGRLIPTTSVEQYADAIGAWFGLTPAERQSALPNLSNFSGGMTGLFA